MEDRPHRSGFYATWVGWIWFGLIDRFGLLRIGLPHLQVLGFVLLSIGTALYTAGMSSVKAVKLNMKLGSTE